MLITPCHQLSKRSCQSVLLQRGQFCFLPVLSKFSITFSGTLIPSFSLPFTQYSLPSGMLSAEHLGISPNSGFLAPVTVALKVWFTCSWNTEYSCSTQTCWIWNSGETQESEFCLDSQVVLINSTVWDPLLLATPSFSPVTSTFGEVLQDQIPQNNFS